jgi:type I restriction enzyme S subunit
MELRPGYKETEIGVIPEDWSVATLGSVARVFDGTHQTPKYVPTGIPFYSVEHVTSGDFQDTKFISEEEHRFLTRYVRIETGDVLMTRIGSIGDCKLVDWNVNASYYVSLALLKFHSCIAGFFVHYSRLQSFKVEVDLHSLPSAIPKKINLGPISDIRFAFPPIQEQSAISETLSDADESIAALTRLIAKKRDLRQGAMQRLLTGQTRLPGFTAPWQEKRLGDHVAFLKNGIQSRAQLTLDDPVRYLHYGDIHVSAHLCLDLSSTDMPRLPLSASAGLTRLQDGDIVFVDASEDLNGVGKSLEIVGAIGFEAVSGQHTIAARFEKSVLADGFKRYLQFIPAFTAHLRRLAAGTKVYATNRKHIASAELQLPETDEQIAIARVLSDMELEISALETRLAKTRALKQAMMQALLTGRVRLPVRRDAAPQSKEATHA